MAKRGAVAELIGAVATEMMFGPVELDQMDTGHSVSDLDPNAKKVVYHPMLQFA